MKRIVRPVIIGLVLGFLTFGWHIDFCCGKSGFVIARVESVYRIPGTEKWGGKACWQFLFESGGWIRILREGREAVRLKIDEKDARVWVKTKEGANEYKGQEKILLSWGYPVPYDYLDPENLGKSEYVVRRNIGGKVFCYKLQKEVKNVSIDYALTNGMIKEALAGKLKEVALRLISIKRGNDILVTQLWPVGSLLWVYEETPFRKSWRISYFDLCE